MQRLKRRPVRKFSKIELIFFALATLTNNFQEHVQKYYPHYLIGLILLINSVLLLIGISTGWLSDYSYWKFPWMV